MEVQWNNEMNSLKSFRIPLEIRQTEQVDSGSVQPDFAWSFFTRDGLCLDINSLPPVCNCYFSRLSACPPATFYNYCRMKVFDFVVCDLQQIEILCLMFRRMFPLLMYSRAIETAHCISGLCISANKCSKISFLLDFSLEKYFHLPYSRYTFNVNISFLRKLRIFRELATGLLRAQCALNTMDSKGFELDAQAR